MNDSLLNLLNDKLADLDSHFNPEGETYHNIFIIGAPRSGTTLLSQLFSGCTNAGYPNNLMALFWNAPVTGALISKKWIKERVFTGFSDFGQTKDYREPHEFGAFWRSNLCMDSMSQPEASDININWINLKNTLQNISRVFSVPVVYKAFHLAWFINEINELLPNSKWIWTTRKTIDNARSILDLRKHLHNDINTWASSKPKGIDKFLREDPYLEVVAQVELINKWIDSQLKTINKESWYSLSLEKFTKSPIKSFEELATWCGVEVFEKNLKKASKNIKIEEFENDQEYLNIKNAYKNFLKI